MSAVPIDTSAAQKIARATEIVLVNKGSNEVLERLTVIRYAGHYRTAGIEAFVVRDNAGKLKVRSETDLGFADTSEKHAYFATDLEQRSA